MASGDGHDAVSYPRDITLTLCDVCGKYVENLLDHYDRLHPSSDEALTRAMKRQRENKRNAEGRGRRRQMRLEFDQ